MALQWRSRAASHHQPIISFDLRDLPVGHNLYNRRCRAAHALSRKRRPALATSELECVECRRPWLAASCSC
eukprot:scaffold23116_cov103-Isochrysis_galbana.AAC.7